ncbi:PAS domain S-box protein [Vibrio sp.]|uniref:PAS domain S-box protein n=1 Tax=Vibrio sp. TaxID=678 RepID=UPI003D12E009
MSFTSRLPTLLLLLGVLMTIAIASASWKANQVLKQSAMDDIARESTLLIRLVDQKLFELSHEARVLPLSLGEIATNQLIPVATSQNNLANLNSLIRNNAHYRRVVLFDKDGRLIAANRNDRFGQPLPQMKLDAAEIRNKAWFKAVLASENKNKDLESSAVLLGPERKMIDNNPNSYDLLFASAIRDTKGQAIGVWINVIDFAVIENIFLDNYQRLANQGMAQVELTLLDKTGTVIIDVDPVGQKKAAYSRDFAVVGQLNLADVGVESASLAVSGLSGSVLSSHFRKGIEQVDGYAHSMARDSVAGVGWSTLVRLDSNIAFALSEKVVTQYLLTALGFLFLVLAAAVYLYVKTRRPISEFIRVADQLAIGNTDIRLPVLEEGRDFGQMMNTLASWKQTLESNRQLTEHQQSQQFHLAIHQRIVDSTKTAIIVCDVQQPDQPIVYVNRAFEQLTGYLERDVLGRNCRFLQGSDTDQPELLQIRKAIGAGKSCQGIVRNYRKDGSLFYNQFSIDPVYNDHNQLTHYTGILTDVTEARLEDDHLQRQLEQQIAERSQQYRESENRLRSVFDTATDGLVVVDCHLHISDMNRSLELMFGRSRSELLGQYLPDLILTPDNRAPEDSLWVKLTNDSSQSIKYPVKKDGLHKSNRLFPIEISFGETELGENKAFVGVIRDISEQEDTKGRELELRQELKQREVIYRTAFSQAAVGISRLSLANQFLEVNDHMCAIFGYREEEFALLTLSDITFQEDLTQQAETVEQVRLGLRKDASLDKRFVRKNQQVFWANLSLSMVHDSRGQPLYWVAILEDITERKRFEAELQQAKNEREELLLGLKLASEAGGVGNWSRDMTTNELRFDENMYKIYGFKPGATISYEQWRSSIHNEDIEPLELQVEQATEAKSPFSAEFRVFNQTTGNMQWVRSSADMLLDEQGNVQTMFGINLDITQERVIQESLAKETLAAQQANQAKSRFLATMSHEIRTPMNGVIGMIDVLSDTPMSNDQQRMMRTIRDSSYSLLQIINDILDFSKIESGQMALEIRPTKLLSLIETTTELLWVNANNKSVELFIDYDLSLPSEIQLDPVRIRQILLNLLGNAIKFTTKGKVRVTASPGDRGHTVILSVQDTGIGMSQTQVNKLFRPFSQADSSTTRKYGGTGLGLSITKSFVDMMQGEIEASSQQNIGSTFTVRLPMHPSDNAFTLASQFDFSALKVLLDIHNNAIADQCQQLLSQLSPAQKLWASSATADRELDPKTIVITDYHRADSQQLRTLMLSDDHTASPGLTTPTSYTITLCPLKPSELLHALAVLSGQASPDWSPTLNETLHDNIVPLNAALHRNQRLPKILCAEDQPTNQLVLSHQLDNLGFDYEMANDGQQALEKWQTGEFGIVLTDCHMPLMDGFELTAEIRRQEEESEQAKTVIIAITANALAGEAERCLDAGMDDYLAKPVEIHTLKRILSERIEAVVKSDGDADKSGHAMDQNQRIPGIDYDYLYRVIGPNNHELMQTIFKMLWENISRDIGLLDQALEQHNVAKVKSIAHGAKGASASAGASDLSQIFKQIESGHTDAALVSQQLVIARKELARLEQGFIEQGIILPENVN